MSVPRYFVSAEYYRGEDGGFETEIPGFGPCGQGVKGSCGLNIKDWRERKTGPCHPLAIVTCKIHKVCFTLYPPGHVPYGRTPLAELATNGAPAEKGRDPPFLHTYFDAALDAAVGIAWPKCSLEGSHSPRFITQCRHLDRCCSLFGLSQEAGGNKREKVAEQLGIGGLMLEEARWKLLAGGFLASGQAICQVLAELRETEPTFQRLATCGHYAAIWPEIQRWDQNRYWRSGFGK